MVESVCPSGGIGAVLRRSGPVLGLLLLVGSLVVGSDLFGAREALFGSATPPPKPSAFSRVVGETPAQSASRTRLRSQPWWQQVESFRGVGAAESPAFEIGGDAIQWRMRWSCQRGRFVVRDPAEDKPLIDSGCAGEKSAVLTDEFKGGLQVEADGPWKMRVDQQVDVPLVEPPLPAMTAPGTSKVAIGGFYRMDQVGKGRMTIYRLSNGRHVLRLSGFYVKPNIDLELRLSPLRAPRTTREYLSAPSTLAAALDITAGSMNFTIPEGVDPSRFRSVVIWCPIISSAYAAATLKQDQ